MTAPDAIEVRRLGTAEEAQVCAEIMAGSEPWITLQRGFDVCLATIQDPATETHVAIDGVKLLGFVIIDMRGVLRGYIRTLCVHPDHRNRRVGSMLLRRAEERIHRESPNVFLCVSSFNHDALRLYQRQGYTLVGCLTNYVVAGHDELLMRKTLGPWNDFHRG